MNTEYDGIVIGGGHNAMVCCGYLARAGLRMLGLYCRVTLAGSIAAASAIASCNCGWSSSTN